VKIVYVAATVAFAAAVCTAQLVRTEEIPVGKTSDFYGKGSIEMEISSPHGEGSREKTLGRP
jgi:hypothetical protein